MMTYKLIVAMDSKNGIGKEGGLPWNLPADLKHFKEITSKTQSPDVKNLVIMGRVTWESIPEKFRPLSGRINIVLSKQADIRLPEGVYCASDLNEIDNIIEKNKISYENAFIIGGQTIYEKSLKTLICNKLYITHIEGDYQCDTFFPSFLGKFEQSLTSERQKENGIVYSFCEYDLLKPAPKA